MLQLRTIDFLLWLGNILQVMGLDLDVVLRSIGLLGYWYYVYWLRAMDLGNQGHYEEPGIRVYCSIY